MKQPAPELGARESVLVAAGLAGLVSIAFGPLIGASGDVIASHFSGDAVKAFFPLRGFGFGELRSGNLPLWNPHSFSGTPFLGAFQMAVLYPLNAVFLVLPTARAINVEFALHLWLLGFTGFLWIRGRGLSNVSAGYAAVVLMLGAPSYLRVVAGQSSVVDVLAWTPLLLMTVDRLIERPSLGWVLVGIAATSLMFLAGHPPTVAMTGLTATLYALPRWWRAGERRNVALAFAAIPVASLLLAAAQLWTGLAMSGEGTRSGGLAYEQATGFSLPPEHLLTLLSPHLFGGISPYWGRSFYWDATAFVGVTTVILALYGGLFGDHPLRRTAVVLAVVLFALSLGHYADLYAIPYHLVPGFSFLRAPSKFLFNASLFVALLAAIGIDRLRRDASGAGFAGLLAGAVAASALAGLLFFASISTPGPGGGFWGALVRAVPFAGASLGESPDVLASWATYAWPGLARSAGFAIAATALLVAARGRPALVVAVAALGVLELASFARNDFESTSLSEHGPSADTRAAYRDVGDGRVYFAGEATNFAAWSGGRDVWGYDSVHLRRYDEFIAFTQGHRDIRLLDNITGRPPKLVHPLFSMLRVGAVASGSRLSPELAPLAAPLRRFQLVRDYRVISDDDAILAALASPGFDPRGRVVLEEEPDPAPRGTSTDGDIRVLDESTDHVSLEVAVGTSAILLMTDSHARGWRARALPGSTQERYQLLRANYTLRAVPVAAGHHRLRIEYLPQAFRAGRWVSAFSLMAYAGAVAWWFRKRWSPGRASR